MAKRILLCDDEVSILRAAEFKFQRAGYDVLVAFDGEQGWEAICAAVPDIVITDCQMPRLDGLGLITRIRSRPDLAELPILLLTAKGYELAVEELTQRYKVARVLAKPFSPRELLQLVESLIGPAHGSLQPAGCAGCGNFEA